MNCQEFESTLNDVLDQRQDPRENESLLEHADACDPCADYLQVYAAIGEYTQPTRPVSLQDRKRFSSYVLAATAAAVLFVLIGPVGSFLSSNRDQVNLAHANPNPQVVVESDSVSSTTGLPDDPALDPDFWKQQKIAGMIPLEQFAFQVPQAPNLEEMGQSINSVWKSIQEDDYLLPIIKQSALFWMPR